MLTEYVTNFALQMGISDLIQVTLTEGQSIGCYDASILSIECKGKLVSEFIHQTDLNSLINGVGSDMLELKIRSALVRMRIMLEP